jgi:hypothetical protein
LGQFATDENHFGGLFFVGQPGFAGFGAHQHMDTLEEHPFVDALHVKNPLVTQQIGSVDLNNATEKLLEALWIKGLIGFKNKRTDVVVVRRLVIMTVIMVWIGAGCVIMVMAVIVAMCVRVIMSMIMVVIVCGIGMIVSQKLWIDIQNGIQIKAADIDDLF